MKEKLSGVFIPVVTSFWKEKFSLDHMADNMSKWNATGVKGYMVLGTNGEFRSLSDKESLDVIRCAVDGRAKGKVLIAGAGRESTLLTKRFVEKACKHDIDYVSLLPPHYFKGAMTDIALVKYYLDIAEMSPKPVLLYNAPQYANTVNIAENVLEEVSHHPMIHGIKDTSPDMMKNYCLACGKRDDFAILSGSLSTFLDGLLQGAVGGVLSAANYMPEKCCALYDLFAGDECEKASELNRQLIDLYKSTSKKYGVAGVKACMEAREYFGGAPRLPLLPMDDREKEELKTQFCSEYNDLYNFE